MLIKSEVVEKIGFLDEEYILALYEDTDYSMKASAAGYRCVIAKGSYIWHHGHGSTGKVKKINTIAEKNKERFYKKWGRPLRVLWAAPENAGSPEINDILASCVELARDGNYLYLFMPRPRPVLRQEVFREAGLIEHANVHLKFYRGKNFKWACLWQVLIKRKKKYDLVITPDAGAASLLKGFRIFYRAMILATLDFDTVLSKVHDLKHK